MEGFRFTRSQLWAVAALAFGLLLGACGGGADSPAAAGKMAPADQQVLRVHITGEPKGIDPHRANFASEVTLDRLLFSSLFAYDEKLQVIPDVAAELPTVENGGISADGTVYTIHLRKSAKWSDGQPLTADDFVYSFKRMLDPKLAGTYTSNYYSVVGAEAYNTALGTSKAPKTPTDGEMASLRGAVKVEAKDASTLMFTLRAPNVSFLQQLAIWPAAPVRKDVVEKYGEKWTEAGNLVGNGPFVLKSWEHNQQFVLEANPNWHRDKPNLNRIVIRIIEDDATAYAAYLNNELDIVTVPAANRREVASPTSPLNKELVRSADLATYALFFNNKDQPWDNPKVRKAFGAAFDRDIFVEGVLQGVGLPTTSWVPPGMPGYNAAIGAQYSFNVEKARQLLAEAGFPEGRGLPPITALIKTSATNDAIALFMQEQFKKVLNVNIDIQLVDSKTYQSRFSQGQFNLTFGSWSADWPYPDNWLPEHFSSKGSFNVYQYSNPKVDDLVKKALAETDAKKALSLFDQVHKIVVDEDAVVVPVYNREAFVLVKPRVKSFVVTGLDGQVRGDANFYRTYIAQ